MSDVTAKPFKVKKGFDFIRDLQEQNEGRDRITYRKIANALQGNFVLGEDFVAWLQSRIDELDEHFKNGVYADDAVQLARKIGEYNAKKELLEALE